MRFNPQRPRIAHLDINSCFATIEQQANPFLRGKPVVVAAYATNSGCILASSKEAKKLGIKTGMRVLDGKRIYSQLVVLSPDPPKYRFVHRKIKKLLKQYAFPVTAKSIDEFVFTPVREDTWQVCLEIKQRIRKEVGEFITVSVGIGPNRYLAKIASNRMKPDGLVEINKANFLKVYESMKLTDLTGIKRRNEIRLRRIGVKTVVDFYTCPLSRLKIAFGGIVGLYWYLRLRGYEIDNFQSVRKTYGNQYAPPPQVQGERLKILSKLCQKTGFRLRKAGFSAQGVHLGLLFKNGPFWHKGRKLKRNIFASWEIYEEVLKLLKLCPIDLLDLPLRIIDVSVFNLRDLNSHQLSFLEDVERKVKLTQSLDSINSKWGDYTVYPARMLGSSEMVKDRISFGQL